MGRRSPHLVSGSVRKVTTMAMTTTQYLGIDFGQSIHFSGMVCCLMAGNKLRVEWMNLEGEPFVLLNPGDGAFNYQSSRLITFCLDTSGEPTLVIKGGHAEDITTITFTPHIWRPVVTMAYSGIEVNWNEILPGKKEQYLYNIAKINYDKYFHLMVW